MEFIGVDKRMYEFIHDFLYDAETFVATLVISVFFVILALAAFFSFRNI